ncbi:MAG TPA: 4'-phosphopantetheinyl transferase superfamily protein [Bacteroidia bacterium]|nr:4'-phosphopantetheinyl transferase superfamily protein [Bacteroidia bacterium]
MPLQFKHQVINGGELAVWKVLETPEELLEILKAYRIYADIPYFRNPKRLSEWLATRALLCELGVKQKIVYNDLGKPYLDGEHSHISISHSGDYVAVITHPDNQVGVDVEMVGDRIHRVSHKFVNESEMTWFSKDQETLRLYIIWGAKECAFKIFGLGSIDFRDHLTVEPFTIGPSGISRVRFKKDEIDCIYQIFFQYLDNLVITYAIGS